VTFRAQGAEGRLRPLIRDRPRHRP
jgi:hypothetical protein